MPPTPTNADHSPRAGASPLVSIIMPAHNVERFITPAIRSVLTQTHRDLELIIVDDASNDATPAIIRDFAAADPRIRVLTFPVRQGVVHAHQAAHREARGTFIGWVDADDLLVNTAIADCLSFLASRPNTGMVFTDHIEIDEHNRLLGEGARSKKPYSPAALLTDFITFHFRLFRREVFVNAGGIDPSFTTSMDYDFCLRASEVTTIERLDKPLYCYRVRSGSISKDRALEQIDNSRRAVQNALRRRNMDATHDLLTEIRSTFRVVPRPTTNPDLNPASNPTPYNPSPHSTS